jgi:uncharacterized membrane-anchored protein YhcB (DUF1043 family)
MGIWQEIIIGLIITLSVFYLIYRSVKKNKKETGCQSCPAAKALNNPKNRLDKPSSNQI